MYEKKKKMISAMGKKKKAKVDQGKWDPECATVLNRVVMVGLSEETLRRVE